MDKIQIKLLFRFLKNMDNLGCVRRCVGGGVKGAWVEVLVDRRKAEVEGE